MAVLVLSYVLPFWQTTRFYFWQEQSSLFAVVGVLFEQREFVLMSIIVVFTMVFPVSKLGALLWHTYAKRRRPKLLVALELLGRFSMLDVFVAALLVVLIKLDAIIELQVQTGFYLFLAATLGSLVLAMLMRYTEAYSEPTPSKRT
nr:paraquat-inducible protein A [Echinimonas agarilytica]